MRCLPELGAEDRVARLLRAPQDARDRVAPVALEAQACARDELTWTAGNGFWMVLKVSDRLTLLRRNEVLYTLSRSIALVYNGLRGLDRLRTVRLRFSTRGRSWCSRMSQSMESVPICAREHVNVSVQEHSAGCRAKTFECV